MTPMTRPKCFARALKKSQLKVTIQSAKQAGFQAVSTRETVKINNGEEMVFAALFNGSFWICRFNKKYFDEK